MIPLFTHPQRTTPRRRTAHAVGLCLGLVILLMHCPHVRNNQQPEQREVVIEWRTGADLKQLLQEM